MSELPTMLHDTEVAAYVKALKTHDWSFEFSDDHGAYLRGHQQHQELYRMAARLDPDRSIWASIAPGSI